MSERNILEPAHASVPHDFHIACRAEIEALSVRLAAAEASAREWCAIAALRGDQYRLILGLMTSLHDAAVNMGRSTELAFIESYVEQFAPAGSVS